MLHDSRGQTMRRNQTLCFGEVHHFLDGLFDGDLHAKRVLSLTNAALGVIKTTSLAVNTIGQGLALARGLVTKHAIKQVDRLLSNEGIDIDAALRRWIPYVVGSRASINVAMDWTDFDADGHAIIMLSLLTRHGRATPLVWLTVDTSTLKNRRNGYEYQVLIRLAEALPSDVKVCIVADRGFGDQKLYRMLTEELKFGYVIRFRGNITVTSTAGETRTAAAFVGPGGRARILRGALVTSDRYQVGTVLCVQDKEMKQAWCLAAGSAERDFARFAEPLWQALEHRVWAARRQGSALRHGHGLDSYQHAREARPPVVASCVCDRAADAARGGRRSARLRSISQVKHHQAAHPFAVPSGLHALRVDPHHAGGALAAVD